MQPISIQRIWLLIQRNFLLNGRKWLAYLGPLLAILFIAWSSSHDDNSNPNYFNTVFSILLIVFGFFQAAKMFPEHKTADGRQSSLTLPASDAEKFFASWMYSGPIFLILFTTAFFALCWVVTGILGMFGINDVVVFNPSHEAVLSQVKFFFLVSQPLGLLAAIAFDRYPAAKVFGTLMAVVGILAALSVVTFRIVYREAFVGFFTPINDGNININMDESQFAFNSESPLILLLTLGLMLLAATYFKFQEKSV